MNSFHSVIGGCAAGVGDTHERIDYRQGQLNLADMFDGDMDLSDLPLDQPLPPAGLDRDVIFMLCQKERRGLL